MTNTEIQNEIVETNKGQFVDHARRLSNLADETVTVESNTPENKKERDVIVYGSELAIYKLAYKCKIYNPQIVTVNGNIALILRKFHTPTVKADILRYHRNKMF